jgi:pilus assembly protein FimV
VAEPQPTEPAAAAQPAPAAAPAPQQERPVRADDFATTPGGDVEVVRGDTLWGITARVRPDSRLTFNQTMLAIYAANPEAFEGNINRLKAGATLRIPSADAIFTINRRDAFAEVQRQNNEWGGLPAVAGTSADVESVTQPNLTLVPPDDDVALACSS